MKGANNKIVLALDAVVITTPEHWHALATVRACDMCKTPQKVRFSEKFPEWSANSTRIEMMYFDAATNGIKLYHARFDAATNGVKLYATSCDAITNRVKSYQVSYDAITNGVKLYAVRFDAATNGVKYTFEGSLPEGAGRVSTHISSLN
jgi:hypothetical protein